MKFIANVSNGAVWVAPGLFPGERGGSQFSKEGQSENLITKLFKLFID
jgi:hypothetical protein